MSKVYLVKIHSGKVKAHQLDLSNVALKCISATIVPNISWMVPNH